MHYPKWHKPVVAIMVVLGGMIPLPVYAWLFAGVPALTATAALKRLNQPELNSVLVDVRSSEEYAEMHVVGSFLWPLDHILALESSRDIPAGLRGRTLLLLCSSGIRSVQAAEKLAAMGVENAYSINGGIQMWVRAGAENPGLRFSQFEYGPQIGNLYKPMPFWQQIAVIVSGFGFKPLHMLLSLLLGMILLRQKAGDLRVLGWGMLIFLAAEVACAVNYLVFDHTSSLAEYLHSYGMVVAFGFTIFAFQDGLDNRLLHISSPNKRCSFVELCKDCVKSGRNPCKARNLIQMSTGMLAILAFLPLAAQPSHASYNTNILGTLYHYCRLLLYQYYESRYLPIAVLLLCLMAFLVMLIRKDEPAPLLARVFLAAALGAWIFSFFRMVLGLVFQEALIWADFWEELTELMFVGSVVVILWIYKRELLPDLFRR